jgi:hypothetical protein
MGASPGGRSGLSLIELRLLTSQSSYLRRSTDVMVARPVYYDVIQGMFGYVRVFCLEFRKPVFSLFWNNKNKNVSYLLKYTLLLHIIIIVFTRWATRRQPRKVISDFYKIGLTRARNSRKFKSQQNVSEEKVSLTVYTHIKQFNLYFHKTKKATSSMSSMGVIGTDVLMRTVTSHTHSTVFTRRRTHIFIVPSIEWNLPWNWSLEVPLHSQEVPSLPRDSQEIPPDS